MGLTKSGLNSGVVLFSSDHITEFCCILLVHTSLKRSYSAFDIFQKVVFCLALYIKEVSLQTFIMS